MLELCREKNLTNDDLTLLRQLIYSENVNTNCTPKNSRETPLLLLCQNNRSDSLYPALQALLEWEGINVDAINRYGHSALTLLSSHHKKKNLVDCIKLLIKYGVNVNKGVRMIKDNSRRNALGFLVRNYKRENLPEIVFLLLNNGLKLNADTKKTISELEAKSPVYSKWFDKNLPIFQVSFYCLD